MALKERYVAPDDTDDIGFDWFSGGEACRESHPLFSVIKKIIISLTGYKDRRSETKLLLLCRHFGSVLILHGLTLTTLSS